MYLQPSEVNKVQVLSIGAAREQLRNKFEQRAKARDDLENAVFRHEDAVLELGRVKAERRGADKVLARLEEARRVTLERNADDIAELNGLLQAIDKDRLRSRRMSDAAHLRGDYRMRDKHNAETRAFGREAIPFLEELRQFQAENKAVNIAAERARSAVVALAAALAKAECELREAVSERTSCEEALFDAEVSYANADAAFAAAVAAKQKKAARVRRGWREIAAQAGVPRLFHDRVKIVVDDEGIKNIYFGGIGKPDGDNHGHYALHPSGKITYHRDPYRPHGAHNYTTPSPA